MPITITLKSIGGKFIGMARQIASLKDAMLLILEWVAEALNRKWYFCLDLAELFMEKLVLLIQSAQLLGTCFMVHPKPPTIPLVVKQ